MKTIRLTMAQALVRFLDNQYLVVDGMAHKFVKGIFAIFGHGNVLGLGQALEEVSHQLDLYQGKSEQGMVHAAVGFAKQKLRHQIFACTSSVGPGAANMITGAATATANRIPVLLLPGDTFASRQPDPVLQQVEQSHNLSLSTNNAFQAVSKFWDRITRPEPLMLSLVHAMRVLTDPAETGAVTIALPQDVQTEAWDYPQSFLEKRLHHLVRRTPDGESIRRAATAIANARHPLIICGGGLRYAQAEQALTEFVKKHRIPFAETQAGKGTVVSSHAWNLGGIGTTGNAAANRIAQNADLIIGIGTRYSDFTTASKWLFQNPQVQFVNINVAAFDAIKMDAISVVSDAKEGLLALSSALKEYQSDYHTEVSSAKEEWNTEINRLTSTTTRKQSPVLNQTHVLKILNDLLPSNAIIVGSAGSLPGDLQRIWHCKDPHSYHLEYGYSCMGYEINAALGVKLATDQPVYAMVGDGSYLMLHSELVTAVQEELIIHVVLFDNQGFGCINNLQRENGMGSFLTEFRHRKGKEKSPSGRLQCIDFAQNAASYGCTTFSITTEEQLKEAIHATRNAKTSTLMDIKVGAKTMTHGYNAWWHVGTAEVSDNPAIQKSHQEQQHQLQQARRY